MMMHACVIFEDEGSGRRAVRIVRVSREMADRKRAEEALRRSEAMLAWAEKIADVTSWEWNFRSDEVNGSGFLPAPPFPKNQLIFYEISLIYENL